MGTKRRRIALSCLECRRRKVKCDRDMPACLRCQKAGLVQDCIYVPYEGDQLSSPTYTTVGRIEREEREDSTFTWAEQAEDYARVASSGISNPMHQQTGPPKRPNHGELILKLEQKVADLEAHIESTRSSTTYAQQTPSQITLSDVDRVDRLSSRVTTNVEQVLLRGRSFKTHFYGSSHFASILLQFDGLSTFIKDTINPFAESLCDIKKAQKTSFKLIRQDLARSFAALSHEHSTLLELVPDKATAGMLVDSYLESFETTYRVLHVPIFRRQYEEFWRAPHETPSSFLVVLLLVMAVVQCVNPKEEPAFLGRSSRLREKASRWIAVCDSWLQAQSCKHVTLVHYQVRVLLFLAKRMNAIKIKRAWTSAGDLVRQACATGLHRDPASTAGKISTFDQEMRRRLWATIMELELLTAIDKGMPAAVSVGDWDCQPPANVHDEELDEHSRDLPPSRPYKEFTRTSYLCICSQSAPLRIQMISTINRIRPTLTYEIAAQFDLRTRQALSNIPTWPELPATHYRPSPRLAKALARLQLVEYTMITYQPFMTAKDNPAYQFFSRTASRDAAASILELYNGLAKTEDLTLRFCRNDAFRAGLCLCYDLYTEVSLGSSVTLNRERTIELLEHALAIQEDRAVKLGQGFYSFWITSSALSLAYLKQAPSTAANWDKYAREAARRVNKLHEMMMTMQVSSVDNMTRIGDGEMPLVDAQSIVTEGTGLSTRLQPAMGPAAIAVPDIQLDFGAFGPEDIWDLDIFHHFSDF